MRNISGKLLTFWPVVSQETNVSLYNQVRTPIVHLITGHKLIDEGCLIWQLSAHENVRLFTFSRTTQR